MKVDLERQVVSFEGDKMFVERPIKDSFGQNVKAKDKDGRPLRDRDGNFVFDTESTPLSYRMMISETCTPLDREDTGEIRGKLGVILNKIWSAKSETTFTLDQSKVIMERAGKFSPILWHRRLQELLDPEGLKDGDKDKEEKAEPAAEKTEEKSAG